MVARFFAFIIKYIKMDSTLQADLQAVADKGFSFSVTVTIPPVEPSTETVEFAPTPSAV